MGGGFAHMSPDGWRWVFWINLPFIGIGAVAVFFFLKMKRVPGNMIQKVCRYDWTGSVLLIMSLVAFLVPLSWGRFTNESCCYMASDQYADVQKT